MFSALSGSVLVRLFTLRMMGVTKHRPRHSASGKSSNLCALASVATVCRNTLAACSAVRLVSMPVCDRSVW